MRQKKAKAFRRAIYGDYALRQPTYSLIKRVVKKLIKDKSTDERKLVTVKTGQIVCTGRRAEYRKAKKHAESRGVQGV